MSNTKQVAVLETFAEVAKARQLSCKVVRLASIRVSSGAYLAVSGVLTFTSALLLRSDNDTWAILSIALAWLVVPALAFADRIVFEGESLARHGPVPLALRFVLGRSQR